jgi:hypothetical protein
MEYNALFNVQPVDADAFRISVYPSAGGDRQRIGRHFQNAQQLCQLLEELQPTEGLRAIWLRYIETRVPLGIKSSYSEWRRLDEWANRNI